MIFQAANIVIFLALIYCLGYSLTRFLKADGLETTVTRLAVGLGSLPALGVIFSILHIPVNWIIVLGLCAVIPLFDLTKLFIQGKLEKPNPLECTSKVHLYILFIIFIISLISYTGGPFIYPWLEDDDSWTHAAGIKYVAVEQNVHPPAGEFQYINPYPPGYDLILGLVHQMQPDLYWVLKFFNGFFICLGFLFFFFFVKQFTGREEKALIATIVLLSTPCYLTHFIWAHSLVIVLFFPAFYLCLKADEDWRYIIPAGTVISGILLTQPTQAIKFCIMLIILAGVFMAFKKADFKKYLCIFALAGLLSSLWWVPALKNIFTKDAPIAIRSGSQLTTHTRKAKDLKSNLFSAAGGSATRKYTFNNYLFAISPNFVNVPVGLGVPLFVLASLGLLVTIFFVATGPPSKRAYALTLLLWFIFVFLGMNSLTFNLPVGLSAFRFWLLFAILVAFLTAESIFLLVRIMTNPVTKGIILVTALTTVVATSGFYKFKVNTSPWPFGIYWHSLDELFGYIWLRENLAPNTKVFAYVDNFFVIGNNMHSDYWTQEYKQDFDDAFSKHPEDLHRLLKKHNYDYMIVGQREGAKFGFAEVNQKCDALVESGLFKQLGSSGRATNLYRVL